MTAIVVAAIIGGAALSWRAAAKVWRARKHRAICDRCGAEVPPWFGQLTVRVENLLHAGDEFRCGVCIGATDRLPRGVGWLRARKAMRDWLRRQFDSAEAEPIGGDKAAAAAKALRAAERRRR
jgi:ribosomal protein L24E